MTAKDRTIRQQQNLIEKYEAEREKLQAGLPVATDWAAGNGTDDKTIDTISTATQTERVRTLGIMRRAAEILPNAPFLFRSWGHCHSEDRKD